MTKLYDICSRGHMISPDLLETLYLHFFKTYKHQTW